MITERCYSASATCASFSPPYIIRDNNFKHQPCNKFTLCSATSSSSSTTISITKRRSLYVSLICTTLSSFIFSLAPASSSSLSPSTKFPISEFYELPNSSGLKVLDLLLGSGDEVPSDGDKVAVHYYGRLAAKQGWRFDSTYDHKDDNGDPNPFVFVLGSGKVIDGIEMAVRSMKVGGIRRVIIPPSVGYQSTSQEPIPPNVEGILMRAADELQALQEERRKVSPETAEAIDQFLVKLRACATGESAFTFILDDPAGNSFVENPFAPSSDPSLTIKFYDRTPEQQALLGYLVDSTQIEGTRNEAQAGGNAVVTDQVRGEPHGSVGATAGHRAIAQSNSAEIAEALFRYTAPEEVMTFPSTCGACATKCETRMFVTNIPYFQEVIVMASTCDSCGYRNSELKPGGRISEKGKRISLHVKNVNDLSRDVIKSDTASVKIPELELELASGTLGGLVSTVEGLITKINESLQRVHGFTFGDSLDENRKSKWLDFKEKLDKLLSLEKPWTLILDDALANSFIAPATDDLKDDNQLTFEEYERTWEQNEELGLNDMDTSAADVAYESANNTKVE